MSARLTIAIRIADSENAILQTVKAFDQEDLRNNEEWDMRAHIWEAGGRDEAAQQRQRLNLIHPPSPKPVDRPVRAKGLWIWSEIGVFQQYQPFADIHRRSWGAGLGGKQAFTAA